ncbi:MAG: hypothetical protein LRZ88_11490, partial [Candidatus Cloacimonetes bacterium]|nr:hypothetical protein [Candidatus Cloacimonadota bacterium]
MALLIWEQPAGAKLKRSCNAADWMVEITFWDRAFLSCCGVRNLRTSYQLGVESKMRLYRETV